MADLNTSPDAGAAPALDTGADAGAAEPSLRDTIDAAFTEASTDDPPPQPGGDGQPRDPAGRFAAKAAAEAAQSLSGTPQAPREGVTSPAPRPGPQEGSEAGAAAAPADLKAPAAWKPTAREKWAGIDGEVKAEVNRREREFQAHLQGSAGLRDFVGAFEDIVRPYEMFIRAENSSPLAAVANLFQTAAALRVETPLNKADMVAGLCQQYAIDLNMLDGALARRYGVAQLGPNGQQAMAPQAPQVFQDPRVDQFILQHNMAQARAQEMQAAEIGQATAAFAEGAEFFWDVREDMADMIELAARRGQILPVKDAYEKACAMHPEVSKIMSSRNSTTSTRATTQAALRARRAASSVKGESSPHGSTTPKDDTLRSAIEAAFDSSGNSRL